MIRTTLNREGRRRHDALMGHRVASARPPDDMLSAMLVSWSLAQMLRCTDWLCRVVQRPAEAHTHYVLSYDETLWARDTWVQCGDEGWLSFAQYWQLVHDTARDALATQALAEDREAHLLQLLRACFVVALAHDARVERFVLCRPSPLHDALQCCAPPVHDTLCFLRTVRPLCEAWLAQRMEVAALSETCRDEWVASACTSWGR